MKRLIVFALLLALPGFTRAEALFDKPVQAGFHGAPQVKLSQANGEFGVLLGGEGMLLANGEWGLGFGVYGLVTRHETANADPDSVRRLSLGYGGLKIGYYATPDYLVHLTFGTLIGLGGARIGTKGWEMNDGHLEEDRNWEGDPVFVFEPEVGVELNVLENLHLNVSASYRLVAGFDSRYGISSSDYCGPAATFGIKFGRMGGPKSE